MAAPMEVRGAHSANPGAVADAVRILLEMDDNRRLEALNVLSQYAAKEQNTYDSAPSSDSGDDTGKPNRGHRTGHALGQPSLKSAEWLSPDRGGSPWNAKLWCLDSSSDAATTPGPTTWGGSPWSGSVCSKLASGSVTESESSGAEGGPVSRVPAKVTPSFNAPPGLGGGKLGYARLQAQAAAFANEVRAAADMQEQRRHSDSTSKQRGPQQTSTRLEAQANQLATRLLPSANSSYYQGMQPDLEMYPWMSTSLDEQQADSCDQMYWYTSEAHGQAELDMAANGQGFNLPVQGWSGGHWQASAGCNSSFQSTRQHTGAGKQQVGPHYLNKHIPACPLTTGNPLIDLQQRAQLAAAATAAAAGTPPGRFSPGPRQGGHHRLNAAGNGSARQHALIAQQANSMLDREEDADSKETLRTHLQDLHNKDPSCVFIVRKINRLGFASPGLLKDHFQRYGPVEAVLVAHSHVKCPSRKLASRLRPSGLGFVVMESSDAVEAILALGDEQIVEGATIRVQRFQRVPQGKLDD